MRRNYNEPAYKKFRQEVRKRDKGCRWPGCRKRRGLQVHHVLTWKNHPALRFQVHNGITLCKKHHKAICGHEDDYIRLFTEILRHGL